MKSTVALIVAASLATSSDAKLPSRFSVERAQHIKDKMQRHYGKDLAGMKDPETGKFDATRLGWARNGRYLGQSITMTIDNLSFDASSMTAFWLGFSKGLQFNGLDRGTQDDIQLSNCFASMYGLMETTDLLAYDWTTISEEEGRWKGFDVFVSDPLKVLADQVVLYEMCEFSGILDQYKQMTSLDWGSLSNNIVRNAMVLSIEMPEVFDQMDSVVEAGKCAAKVAVETAQETGDAAVDSAGKLTEDTWDEFGDEAGDATKDASSAWDEGNKKSTEDWSDDSSQWDSFAEVPSTDGAIDSVTGDLDASAKKAKDKTFECANLINRFEIGELGGKLFKHFFNNSVEPIA